MAYEIIEENNPNNYFTSDNIPSLSYYRSFIWATFLFFTEPFLEAAAGGFAESLETSSWINRKRIKRRQIFSKFWNKPSVGIFNKKIITK